MCFLMLQAVSQRVTNKLMDRFFMLFLELERLKPQTPTQTLLYKHVKQVGKINPNYVLVRVTLPSVFSMPFKPIRYNKNS